MQINYKHIGVYAGLTIITTEVSLLLLVKRPVAARVRPPHVRNQPSQLPNRSHIIIKIRMLPVSVVVCSCQVLKSQSSEGTSRDHFLQNMAFCQLRVLQITFRVKFLKFQPLSNFPCCRRHQPALQRQERCISSFHSDMDIWEEISLKIRQSTKSIIFSSSISVQQYGMKGWIQLRPIIFFNHHMSKTNPLALALLGLLFTLGYPWCLKTTLNLTASVDKIDFAPDRSFIAVTSSSANRVYVYDTINYFKVFTYTPAAGTVKVARFCRNSTILAVGRSDGQVVLLKGKPPFSNTVLDQFQPDHNVDIVIDIDFSYGGDKLLLCYSNDDDPEVIDNWGNPSTRSLVREKTIADTVTCKWSKNDDMVIATVQSRVDVYAVPATGAIGAMKTRITAGTVFTDVAVKPTTTTPVKIVVSGGYNSGVNSSYFFNTAVGATVTPVSHTFVNPPTATVRAACYSGDGLFYAVAGDDKKVWIFDDATDSQVRVLTDSSNNINDCEFTIDGTLLAAATAASAGQAFVYIYSKTCFFCSPGFFVDTFGACTPCDTSIVSCSLCYYSNYCVACSRGYYLASWTSCLSCHSALPGCSTCINSTTCVQCNQGYYRTAGGVCAACTGIHTGCLACNLTNCWFCELDYHLSGSSCTRCSTSITNCLRCSANNNCLQCTMGYYSTGTSCTVCNPACMQCQGSAGNCSVCTRGHHLTNNTCLTCSANCLDCTDNISCYDCATGYYLDSNGSCMVCSYPCTTCNTSALDCLSCPPGLRLVLNTTNNNTSDCTLCPDNCSLCLNSTVCTACNLGHYLSSPSPSCLLCSELYPDCLQCSQSVCYSCSHSSYLLNSTFCQVCDTAMDGCLNCDNSSVCGQCAAGYYHGGGTGSSSCVLCGGGCQLCQSASVCLECWGGYHLNNGSCLSCSPPCLTCGNSTLCESCTPGYFFQNSTCNYCPSPCATCLSSAICVSCSSGHFLINSTCSVCPSNCLDCNSTNCHNCHLGYYQSSSNTCSPCLGNCTACNNSGDCLLCPLGYYLNTITTPDQCLLCSSMDTTCLECNSTGCLACIDGYYSDAGLVCQPCSLNVSDCAVCSSALVCTQCSMGYQLVSPSACSSCSTMPGCLACSNTTTCTLCASGLFLSSGGCLSCAAGCSECTDNSSCVLCDSSSFLSNSSCIACESVMTGCSACTDNATCLACDGDHLLSGTSCQPCSLTLPACSLCDHSGTCVSCQQGYYLSNSTCQLCSFSPALQGCLLCSSSSVCEICTNGYYLSAGNCLLCSNLPGCEQCSANGSSCSVCSGGYGLTNGSCQLCSTTLTGCIFCSSALVCTQCQGGYYLSNSTCLPCSQPNCQICSPSSPLLCLTCNSGYYPLNSTCLPCSQTGCLSCNSSHCLTCQTGYYLSNDACVLCSSALFGCSKCSSSSVCLQCQSLLFLSNDSCVACSSAIIGCSFCSDNSTCLACDGGYYLNSSSNHCDPCSALQGCLICDSSSVCLTCGPGYFQTTSSCSLCNASLPFCFLCDNSTNCTVCKSGYQIDNTTGQCQPVQITAGASTSSTSELVFKSHYLNETHLKHSLAVADKNARFEGVDGVDWAVEAKIVLVTTNGDIVLTVLAVELSADSTTLYFFTNNPAQIGRDSLPVASKGRILAGQSITPLNMQASLSLPKSIINAVLPSILLTSDLSLSYDLNDSTFYVTYVHESYSSHFSLFGYIVVALLFLYGLARATCLEMYGRNCQIVGHVLALKCFSLVVFPSYAEYVNFCLGFMAVDLPWLNVLLPSAVANEFDYAPTGYYFYFTNMNLAAMHLITTGIFLLLLILAFCLFRQNQNTRIKVDSRPRTVNLKFKAVRQFMLNFFCFGMVFAGFSSLLGAFINGTSLLKLNNIFYILGILLFGAFLSEAFSSLVFSHRLCRLRVALKATFLAGAGLNPLYLASVTLIVDLILMIIEFKIRRNTLISPRTWLASNLCIWTALFCLFFIPDSFLALGVVMFLVIVTLFFEIYQLCQDKNLTGKKHIEMFEEEQNINVDESFVKVNDTNQSIATIADKDEKMNKDIIFDSINIEGDQIGGSPHRNNEFHSSEYGDSDENGVKFEEKEVRDAEELQPSKVEVSAVAKRRRVRKFMNSQTSVDVDLEGIVEEDFTLD